MGRPEARPSLPGPVTHLIYDRSEETRMHTEHEEHIHHGQHEHHSHTEPWVERNWSWLVIAFGIAFVLCIDNFMPTL